MDNKPIDRLESYLEQFVEGAFAAVFGRRIRAHDIALRLARAMDDNCIPATPGDPRPIAPDRFVIHTNPEVQIYLHERHPGLILSLSDHLIQLAKQRDYRMENSPTIKIIGNPTLDKGTLHITSEHTSRDASSTAAMQAVKLPLAERPTNAQVIINDMQAYSLKEDILNIGRHEDNDIVIDDPTVSRRHLQIRLRYGAYIVFDVHSRTGMLVNGFPAKEHRLNSGDVIAIGNTRIIYLHDQNDEDDHGVEATAPFEPL